MLSLTCPHCGPRDETEFSCGGESHIERPGVEASDETWADYLFVRDNPRGVTFERWHHRFGCGAWFNVARDTVSHEIKTVYPMGAPRPTTP
ncbi:sarcosine oxidase subunit delta [Sphingobium algorifonticola]|uniref:Sarcosine oxidase subunit delta family protein n=1 Tax=Sphingobium algorifonticola TaxID=2008318 RepID=A0A437J5R0_9SPHN|nr:sarcosine oxidase subunit delta [Sphingobium algorifonticola]RVT40282.1 sarcosine oxidase subunit delta family protein [Sphingobium algorifonticola]